MSSDHPNLDLLRTSAVLMVVLSHLLNYSGWNAEHIYRLSALGFLGVAVFFVHTSLVLMMSLGRQQPGPLAVPFFIRRLFRIYPLSIIVVLAVTLAAAMQGPVDAGVVVSNLLLVQNLTGAPSTPPPLWSLPYEVQMYLLLPALYLLAVGRRGAAIVLAAWAASIVAVVVSWELGIGIVVLLVKFVPCFLPGVLAHVLTRDLPARPQVAPHFLFAALALLVILFPAAVARAGPSAAEGQAMSTMLAWLVCLGLGLAIPFCRSFEAPRLAALSRTIATYSYGIYLIHGSVMDVAFAHVPGPWAARFLAFAVATAALSYLAHHWIEVPGIRLGQRLAARRAGRAGAG